MSEKRIPEVSVYCPAYNHEKYIRKTLDGFVMQRTAFTFEVIVHDDASADGTAEIIREYAEKYPELFRPIFQSENQYSGKGQIFRRFIYPMIRGKYIAVCEGDDYWTDPCKLQKQYDILEVHPECVMCTHAAAICDADGKPRGITIPEPSYRVKGTGIVDRQEFAEMLWLRGRYPFQTSSYFYRRILEDTERPWTEEHRDRDLLWQSLLLGETYFLADTMSVYRVGSAGSWNSRLRARDANGFRRFKLKNAKAMLAFDSYSGARFHQLITTEIFPQVVFYLMEDGLLTPEETREIYLGYREGIRRYPEKRSRRAEARYLLYTGAPGLYRAIRSIKEKGKTGKTNTPDKSK